MSTKAEQEKIIRAQEQTIGNLREQVASLQGGVSGDVGELVLDNLTTIRWKDPRTGASDDNGQELPEWYNFGPMMVVSRMATAVGVQRFQSEHMWRELDGAYQKLVSVMAPEDMAVVWPDNRERARQAAEKQYDQLVELENSLLRACEKLECPKWSLADHYAYVEERGNEIITRREDRRAKEAS